MNKIDFKNIRNQFESMIQFFDGHKIVNQKIFSAVFDLNVNCEDLLGYILPNYNYILDYGIKKLLSIDYCTLALF